MPQITRSDLQFMRKNMPKFGEHLHGLVKSASMCPQHCGHPRCPKSSNVVSICNSKTKTGGRIVTVTDGDGKATEGTTIRHCFPGLLHVGLTGGPFSLDGVDGLLDTKAGIHYQFKPSNHLNIFYLTISTFPEVKLNMCKNIKTALSGHSNSVF